MRKAVARRVGGVLARAFQSPKSINSYSYELLTTITIFYQCMIILFISVTVDRHSAPEIVKDKKKKNVP